MRSPGKALGIDICNGRIHMALLKRTANGGVKLLKAARGFVPDGAMKDGNIENPALLASAIKKLKAAMNNFEKGVETDNNARAQSAFYELQVLIDLGADKQDVWKEINSLFETRKRLAIAERERITSANAMWTAEQAMLFVTTVSGSFKDVLEKHVGDDSLRADVLSDLTLIIRKLINQTG